MTPTFLFAHPRIETLFGIINHYNMMPILQLYLLNIYFHLNYRVLHPVARNINCK
jgi:hypothetical protein